MPVVRAVVLLAVLLLCPQRASADVAEQPVPLSEAELARIVHANDGRPLILVVRPMPSFPGKTGENPGGIFRERAADARRFAGSRSETGGGLSLRRSASVSGSDWGCGHAQGPLGNARTHNHTVPPGWNCGT